MRYWQNHKKDHEWEALSVEQIWKILRKHTTSLAEHIVAYGWNRSWYQQFALTWNRNNPRKVPLPLALQRLMNNVRKDIWENIAFREWVWLPSKEITHEQRGLQKIAKKEDLQSAVFMNFIRQELQWYQDTGLMTRFRYTWEEAIDKWNRTYSHNHGFHIPVSLDRKWQDNVCTILGISSASSNTILHTLGFNDLNLPWKNARGKVKNRKSKK
jgi:hypothetical protein